MKDLFRIRLFLRPNGLWSYNIVAPDPRYGVAELAAAEPDEDNADENLAHRRACAALRREREYHRKGYGPEDYKKAAERRARKKAKLADR